MLKLDPYNYYILLGAAGLLLVFLIVTIAKTLGCLKTVNELNTKLEPIKVKGTLLSIKSEVIKEKAEADSKTNGLILKLIPVLLAINTVYKKKQQAIQEGKDWNFRASVKALNQARKGL